MLEKEDLNWKEAGQFMQEAKKKMLEELHIRRAANLFEKAQKANQRIFESNFGPLLLGICYIALKQPEKAIECLENVVKTDKSDKKQLLQILGEAYLENGENEKAEKCFKSINSQSKKFIALGTWVLHLENLTIMQLELRLFWNADTQEVTKMSGEKV